MGPLPEIKIGDLYQDPIDNQIARIISYAYSTLGNLHVYEGITILQGNSKYKINERVSMVINKERAWIKL